MRCARRSGSHRNGSGPIPFVRKTVTGLLRQSPVVSNRDGEIELDPHVDGSCKLTLDEDGAGVLRDAHLRSSAVLQPVL